MIKREDGRKEGEVRGMDKYPKMGEDGNNGTDRKEALPCLASRAPIEMMPLCKVPNSIAHLRFGLGNWDLWSPVVSWTSLMKEQGREEMDRSEQQGEEEGEGRA